MKNSIHNWSLALGSRYRVTTIVAILSFWAQVQLNAQCIAPKRSIMGNVFQDSNNNGIINSGETGISGVLVNAFDASGINIGSATSDSKGEYMIQNLTDDANLRLQYSYPTGYAPSKLGKDNGSSVQFVQVPSCGVSFGLTADEDFCNLKTEMVTTCFVQGAVTVNTMEPTIVGIEYGFNSASPARKFSSHGETGSIWGITWKRSTKEIFTAAFVKQYSGLKDGHDAIFKTKFNGTKYTTSTYTKLSALGIDVGTLAVTDVSNCAFGEQVGKMGLGNLVISADDKWLYTINLNTNQLVKIASTNPSVATTKAVVIPGLGARPFALKFYNDKLYIGITYPGKSFEVLSTDSNMESFTKEFTTTYIKGDWYDNPANSIATMQWLTDLDFTDDGNMLLGISDRVGHRYCNVTTNRLDDQKPDLLMVWNDNGTWKLENNGKAGALTGTGVNNNQGPGNGEFFGDDFWIANPSYHNEIALGSIFVLPGSNSVVAAVFDPETNAYSGGLHRYNTQTGKKEGSKELYVRDIDVAFGKASGFGDLIITCGLPEVEIGNYVWLDINKNGTQDAGESGLANVTLHLLDEECNVLGTTTTDLRGNYVFNSSNISGGLVANETYFIQLDKAHTQAGRTSYLINANNYQMAQHINGVSMLDSDGVLLGDLCAGALIEVQTAGTSHNFDLGFVPRGACAIKLDKKVLNDKLITIKDKVTFELKVTNIGGTEIKGFTLEDVLPRGYVFDATLNPLWTMEAGKLTAVVNQVINEGESNSVNLVLSFNQNENNISFTNTATILSYIDDAGLTVTDLADCLIQAEDRMSSDFPPVCDLALIHKIQTDRIYTADSKVTFVTTVCNQGTIDANGFEINNYLNPEFDFDPSLNKGWNISSDLKNVTFGETNVLKVGSCRDYLITYTILDEVEVAQIVNYAEISKGSCFDGVKYLDFDSNPDTDAKNDKGGVPNSLTDNVMNSRGDIDEDDHDPAVVRMDVIDLSLQKTVRTRRVFAGGLVTFDLKITNEGKVPVSRATLVDYLSGQTTLEDNTWTKVDKNAEKTIIFPGNLQPGESYTTSITCRINANLVDPATVINVAEIKDMYDEFDSDISPYDIDSTPDNIKDNDYSDITRDLLEDDIATDFAVLISQVVAETCTRCRVASTPTNGQFEVRLKLASRTGETWTVESSIGLFDFASALPPAIPTPLTDGTLLSSIPHENDGHSYYFIDAVYQEGRPFSIRFRNEFGDLEQINVNAAICTFKKLSISGPNTLCLGSVATYNVAGGSNSAAYTWTIDGEVITGEEDNEIAIDWSIYMDGVHEVSVSNDDDCTAPAVYQVAIGIADGSSIACIGDFNVSMDGDCSVVITPSMLVAGLLRPSSPYIVMLTDMHGKPIPNATLTSVHVGTKVMAKLLEGCGGNSCWSTITVEDKIAPVSICRDITLPCYKVDEYAGPFESDNCDGPITTAIVNETITTVSCDNDFVKFIDRAYQATDKYGNKSRICNMRISVQRPNLALIKWPRPFTMANDSALVCNSYVVDELGRPSIEMTGVPTIANLPMYPSFESHCNVAVGFVDKDLGYIGCTRKIMRTWTVFENWCSNFTPLQFIQVIEITDNVAPTITAIPNITVSTTGKECAGLVALPLPIVVDSCSGLGRVDVTYPGGLISDYKTIQSIKLPAGNNLITYTAYDACLNARSITFNVTVEDLTAPTVICKGIVVAGLNSNGEAYIRPSNVNDGSYDGCGIDSMRIARMVTSGFIPDRNFVTELQFGCADVGQDLMVALKVWDVNGNSNSCMVSLEIQDKIAPRITCPANLTIDCSEIFTGVNLTQYGTATVIDACGATLTELAPIYNLNSCREGTITRTFVGADLQNSVRCTQILTVVNNNRFSPARDVTRSIDFTVTDRCSFDELKPENLTGLQGFPEIRQTACSQVAASYKDEVYTFNTGACYKIVRNWTVLDWCEMNRLGSDYKPFRYQQTIKIIKTRAPQFVDVLRDTTFSTQKGNCNDVDVRLRALGTDNCALVINRLNWSYSLDLNNNGSIDITNKSVGSTAIFSGKLPLGTHRIIWSFEDGCGNLVSQDQLITVRSSDKPIIVSLDKVSVAIVPWDLNGDGKPDIEKACIKAYTLNVSSLSLCCIEPLKYSYSKDVTDTLRCFECFDVGDPNLYVQLVATDCFGNQDSVRVKIDVQDNNDSDVCERICIENPVVAIIAGPSNVCSGIPNTLTATGGVRYSWNTGATTASITVAPSSTLTYTVTVTNEFRCTDVAEKLLTVSQPPTIAIIGANICQGGNTNLTASGAAIYLWSTGATTATINVSPVSTRTYSVTGTDSNGCISSASRVVNVFSNPIVTITGDNSVCINETTTLTASGGNTYLWSTGATTPSINVTPTANTTYSVTATNGNNCSASAQITVTVNGLTINVQISGDNSICPGETSLLTASGAIVYQWSTGATTTVINVTPPASTTYTVTGTDVNGCRGISSFLVTVNPTPTIVVVGNLNICPSVSTTLTASGGNTYAWSNGANTAAITVTPLASTTYTVTTTDFNGCTASTSRTVVVNPTPNAQITGDNQICINETTVLTASGGTTYLWNNGATTAAISVSPLITTTYNVTVTSNSNCTAVASRTVNVNGLTINIQINGDNSICPEDSSVLTATGGISYVWSTGATTPSITVRPASTTSYVVTGTDTNGCNGLDTFIVVVNTPAQVLISGDNNICIGDITSLTASGAVSYVWSTGATTATISVNPIINTTYTVTSTDTNGCNSTATSLVTVNPLPTVTVTGDDKICLGTSTTLTASGGTLYVWSNNATTASITVSPAVTTTYLVTVTNANGCVNTGTRTVTVDPLPTPIISGDLAICIGDTTTLTVSGGVSYLWSTGSTVDSIDVFPAVSTAYTVTATDANGCVGTTTATVLVDPGVLTCETQNITVYIDENGQVTIDPQDVSISALGECLDIISSITPNQFFCNDAGLGPRIVVLEVTNTNTNESLRCTAEVTILDTISPVLICPANITISCENYNPNLGLGAYGNATATDNCPAGLIITETPIININTCNIGQITRTFTATDLNSNSTQCVQLITVAGGNPITISDITFPSDTTINNCQDASADSLGRTIVNTSNSICSSVSVDFVDNLGDPLCGGTFQRTWTVVDSCAIIPGTTNGIFTHVQNINITVLTPVITGPTSDTIYVNPTTCMAEFNGTLHTASGCNLTLENSANAFESFDLSGVYPPGINTITLTATEGCTNLTVTFTFILDVIDTTANDIRCFKIFPTITMDGTVTVDVSDHVAINQSCSQDGVISASYTNTSISDTLVTYTCADLLNSPLGVEIFFWVDGQPAPFFECITLVGISDPGNFCGPTPSSIVFGGVNTESREVVEGTTINLEGSGLPAIKTDNKGRYRFPEMPSGGTYDLIPTKNDEPLAGVSTLDIIGIQRHILGIQKLGSPYKYIAADVNNDKRITASDMIDVRKLILGIYDNFPRNTSWRMIDQTYKFADLNDPLYSPLVEQYHIEKLSSSMNINWVGVKIGDVNGSFTANAKRDELSTRSSNALFQLVDQKLTLGQNILPVFAAQSLQLSGFQLAIKCDDMTNVRLESEAISLTEQNYSFNNGYLIISWDSRTPLTIAKGEELFRIVADVVYVTQLSNTLSIASDLLQAEYYDQTLRTEALKMSFIRSTSDRFEVFGNSPNPWNNETNINFFVPNDGKVMLKVRDITGKMIYQSTQTFSKGENIFTLTKEKVGHLGVLIYDLTFENEVKTLKMINIE